MTGAARWPPFGETLSVRIRSVILWRGTMCEGGHRLEEFIDMVQVRDQLEPERDFGGTVVVSDTGLQADVEVQLLFRGVLRPGHFLKPVRFSVDEFGVLRNWLIWVTGKIEKQYLIYSHLNSHWVI